MARGRYDARMSAPPAHHTVHTDQRLTELEVKLSFAEDLLDHLNALVARQQQQIDLLVREVMRLREQAPEGTPAMLRNLRDEIPPHY